MPMEGRQPNYYRLRGEELYTAGHYLEALEMFEKYEEGNPEELLYDEVYLHLKADIYYKLGRFDDALKSYELVLTTDPQKVDYVYFKGLIFRSTKPTDYSYVLAIIDSVEQEAYASYSFFDTLERFTVEPFHAINTEHSEFAAVDFKDRIYFSSITDRRFTRKDVNTKLTHYDIYSVNHKVAQNLVDFEGRSYGRLTQKERQQMDTALNSLAYQYEDVINTSYNNGPITFYSDDVAFVTINEKHDKSEINTYNLTLNLVSLSGDSSKAFTERAGHYFGTYFSPADVGQITFSKNRENACMAVKLKDSPTESDLWLATRKDDGTWNVPYIASDTINTVYDDLFPYWSEDDYLYYSTNGLKGIGGLDVFRIDMLDPNALPQNVGFGVNTPYDDFAFSLNEHGKGYLTSNRPGGRGSDDIYTVSMNYGYIKVVLLNNDTSWVDNPLFKINDCRIDDGIDSVNVKLNSTYYTQVLPYGEYDLIHSFPVDSQYEHIALYDDTAIVYVQFPELPPDTLPVRFTNFCFNCDDMDEINAEKFTRMLAFLLEFPEVSILLTGNTDMFGTDKYNDALGMRRSDIMERWLREAGVDNPIVKKSNGKRKLISEIDHRLNRRVDVELFWTEHDERIDFVSRSDERLIQDIVIIYEEADEFEQPFVEGYYIKLLQTTRFMDIDLVANKFGIGNDFGVILHSNKWNEFSYYLEVPLHSVLEAQDIIDLFGLNAKIVYLK